MGPVCIGLIFFMECLFNMVNYHQNYCLKRTDIGGPLIFCTAQYP